MYGITCPRCGRTITSRGGTHEDRSGSQWECACGYIEQDHGQGRVVHAPYETPVARRRRDDEEAT